mmetsp:Transcript_17/g.53  ORF Transcript_17/g.53 Transcript_17/m.53 type:complete len:233 (+) Transcript_17:766-1464(+)
MLHCRQLRDRLLQGFQLDPDPANLYLPVHSSVVVDAAVTGTRSKVSGVVDAANARQLDELMPRLLLLFQISAGQANASHKQDTSLAFGLHLHGLWVQDVAVIGGQLCSDRDRIAALDITPGANHRNLRRPIAVEEPAPRRPGVHDVGAQGLTPNIQDAQIRQPCGCSGHIFGSSARHGAEVRGHDTHSGDLLLLQPNLHVRAALLHEIRARHAGGPGSHSAVDLDDVNIPGH